MDDLGVAGISKSGKNLAYGNGTSYSAPLVSRLASHLFACIPNATSPLIRAMLIHFSAQPDSNGFENATFLNLIGNGFPISEKLINSNPWEQSFLYQGEVNFRKIYTIPFFVPKCLTNRKGNNILGIRLTISFRF